MKKMKRLLGLFLSLALVFGLFPGMSLTAYATDYPTGLTDGQVLYVGDTFTPEVTYRLPNWSISSNIAPVKLVRFNVTPGEKPWDEATLEEAADGQYYGFMDNDGDIRTYWDEYDNVLVGLGEYAFEATENSDGLIVTKSGANVSFALHEASNVAVTGVTLSPTTASLTAGGAALELTPTVAPEGATDKTVKWSVEQTGDFVALYTDEACTQAVGTEAIAAAKVYVKPLAAGQATITVTTNDGAKTATCAVTVAEPTYNVTFKAGTEDGGNWTATPSSAKKGQTVTVKYTGTKKVKSVKAIKK